MKKLLLIACLAGTSFFSISQIEWRKGGNNIGGGANSSLGTNTTWNAPLILQTFGVNRTKINGNLSYAVNGFTDVRNGYMLLSPLQNGGRGFTLFPLY
jgi:hypothetical protein